MNTQVTLTLFQLISIILFSGFLFYVYRLLAPELFYKIHKPFFWTNRTKQEQVSQNLKKLEKSTRDKVRFYTFHLQIERLKKSGVSGAFAELGVYKGKTAKIIHLMDTTRDFHLFDTFDGFDEQDLQSEKSIDRKYSTSNFADTDLESVKAYIAGNENVHYHPGFFPDTVENLDDNFAFVHLDADLYQPTIVALNYFYPKLSPGGVIIIHDYNHTWYGVSKAVDEFSKTIPEVVIEIADWQGSAMIIKNLT